MRLAVQRVSEASCTVDGVVTGAINTGFMVLVGFCNDDTEEIVVKMANKLKKLRVFDDADGKMNLSLKDVDGSTKMYDYFNSLLEDEYQVEKGIFGADMKIKLLNDGPVTIIMDSKEML